MQNYSVCAKTFKSILWYVRPVGYSLTTLMLVHIAVLHSFLPKLYGGLTSHHSTIHQPLHTKAVRSHQRPPLHSTLDPVINYMSTHGLTNQSLLNKWLLGLAPLLDTNPLDSTIMANPFLTRYIVIFVVHSHYSTIFVVSR